MKRIPNLAMGKVTCPFCFGRFPLGGVRFRCESPPNRCERAKDEVFERFWNKPSPVASHAFSADPKMGTKGGLLPGLMLRSANCPKCGNQSNTKLCPVCHSELPPTIGESDGHSFAVIGAKEAGKSHYIATLIDAIKNVMGPDFNCSLQALNDDTVARYRRDFYNPLFRERQTIFATRSVQADASVRQPLAYSLRFRRPSGWSKVLSLLNRSQARQDVTDVVPLSFFDSAGEDLDSEDVLRTENKYIFHSRGLILLLDPLQIPAVRMMLAGKLTLPHINTETEDIVERVARLIRKANQMKSHEDIQIPIAVVFSKCDALAGVLSKDSPILHRSWNAGAFDLGAFQQATPHMEALLETWGCESLLLQIKTNFKRYGFFGVSSLGCSPDATNRVKDLKPSRVLDPFLWLLSVHGIVKTAR